MGGPDQVELPTITPPVEGVDRSEWDDLIVRGRTVGVVPAEEVAQVLRHVELTGDVLHALSASLNSAGIAIDDEVYDIVDDDTPEDGDVRPAVGDDEADEKLLTRRRGRRNQKRPVRVDVSSSDGVHVSA